MPFLYRGSKPVTKRAPGAPLLRAEAERLFQQHYKSLFASALPLTRNFVGNAEDAEDVVQNAFSDLWTSCFEDGDVDPGSVKALFLQILRRRIADFLREEERDTARDSKHVLSIARKIRNDSSIERVAEGSELASRLEYIVESLPPPCRRVYKLVAANDGDVREAASQLSMNYNTARWHLTRAKEKIREALEKDGYPVPAALRSGPTGSVARRET